ncbi:hypothetical protein BDB00DRAFT_801887 [Zychaea mexicana]|uniref:uncharacterized protein n=1 Tax=Zychaea mexicana TaxID=64656 RepID=UPI0022FE4E01|nr:uncharacterized protein BDB00DRAFT_801887 [Zychaea mexicana]KAI9497785.1 hypothetical protein BDB00DRAFT_801887 [Zychaea mexicana]
MPINKKKVAARKAVATRKNAAAAKVESKKEQEVNAKEEQQESGSESESDADNNDEELKDASDEEKDSESGSSSSSEEEEEEEEEEEKATEKEQEMSENDDDEESSSSSDSENSKKRKAEDDLEEEQQPVKALKVEHVPKGPKTSFTVFVGQLNYDATYDQVKEHFSKCGDIKEIRLSSYGAGGKNKGTCFIDFEDKEGHDAALKLNGVEFMGRKIKVDHDEPRKKEAVSEESNILFYANLDWAVTEKQLENLFSQHGEVVSVTLLTKPGPERSSKGCGFVEFEEKDSAVKAFSALRDSTVDGRPLRLDYAGPRGSSKINRRPNQEKGGFKKGGFNKGGFKKGGFNKGGFNKGGFNKGGFKNGNNRGQGQAGK